MTRPGLTGHRPSAAGLGVACLGVTVAVALTGCVDHSPAPAATSPIVRATATPVPTSTTTGAPSAATTSTIPGMPAPTASGPSAVDATAITSLGSLPAAFRCPTTPSPITIPAVTTPTTTAATTAPTATAATTTAPLVPAPAAVVCPSPLAGDEALYLWYAPTPELKLAALTAALSQTKYVHAGPNWVAGGTLHAAMGTVGGEVYR